MEILNNEIIEKFGVRIKYALFECVTCGRSFGKNIGVENSLEKRDLLCNRCAINKMADLIEE